LVGGFPCQPFSHAGLRHGFDDTRGTLFFEIQRIIEAKKPKAILLENVRGLKGHDGGNTLRRILEILGQEYVVSTRVFNSKDFGLPQNRSRIYICAIRADLTSSGTFDLGGISGDLKPTRLGDILEDNVESRYTISDRLWAGHRRRKAEHQAKGNGFGYRIFNTESIYTSTISARYYKDGSEILIEQQGTNPRKLTPREAARLQGFPDWFVPCESEAQAYKQFGNAVSVSVVQAIAEGLVKDLFRD
jgi:DNA (cytosine-5)-methyltransferase 1